MESILRTAMDTLGKDVVMKAYEEFIASQSVKDTTGHPTKEGLKKKTTKKETEEKKQKRIPRMSAPMLKQLQSELTKANVEVDFEDKKETDKIKKNFVSYVDDLTEDDFTEKNIAQHMRDFANLQTKKAEEKQEEKEDDTVHKLTLKELQSITLLSESDKLEKGVYWDGDSGRKVTGPDRDQDEDLEEKTFKKIKYIVGETTGRVYLDDDESFVGYIGVSKFKEMI